MLPFAWWPNAAFGNHLKLLLMSTWQSSPATSSRTLEIWSTCSGSSRSLKASRRTSRSLTFWIKCWILITWRGTRWVKEHRRYHPASSKTDSTAPSAAVEKGSLSSLPSRAMACESVRSKTCRFLASKKKDFLFCFPTTIHLSISITNTQPRRNSNISNPSMLTWHQVIAYTSPLTGGTRSKQNIQQAQRRQLPKRRKTHLRRSFSLSAFPLISGTKLTADSWKTCSMESSLAC